MNDSSITIPIPSVPIPISQPLNSFGPKKKEKWELTAKEKVAAALKLKDSATGMFKVVLTLLVVASFIYIYI